MNPDPSTLPLRDIHLPETVHWWPLAPGWWLLAIALAAAAGVVLYLRRRQRRLWVRRVALAEFERLENEWRRAGDAATLVADISALLRRLALSAFPRDRVAALTGEAWLDFLDAWRAPDAKGAPDLRFTSPIGRALLSEPYRRTPGVDPDQLLRLCTDWARRLPAQEGRA